MASTREDYLRSISNLMRDADRLERETVEKVLDFVEDLKRTLRSEVARLTGRLDIQRVGEIRRVLRDAAEVFGDRLSALTRQGQEGHFDVGSRAAFEPLASVGLGPPERGVSARDLAILQGFSGELITNLRDDIVKEIDRKVQLAALGQTRPGDLNAEIDSILTATDRRKAKLVDRAEKIARTELNRAYTLSNIAALEKASEFLPDLQKEWISTLDGRTRDETRADVRGRPPANHVVMNGERRDFDDRFSNGLLYPLDPGGPPQEVVNCRCRVVAFRPDWGSAPGAIRASEAHLLTESPLRIAVPW